MLFFFFDVPFFFSFYLYQISTI
uniref:Uncharacterized protein n=1 Tax=Rhizophora mucronata TaxID=61149 RepID=A0A2P2JVA4_RHIMU